MLKLRSGLGTQFNRLAGLEGVLSLGFGTLKMLDDSVQLFFHELVADLFGEVGIRASEKLLATGDLLRLSRLLKGGRGTIGSSITSSSPSHCSVSAATSWQRTQTKWSVMASGF